jgi:hypothetical protein
MYNIILLDVFVNVGLIDYICIMVKQKKINKHYMVDPFVLGIRGVALEFDPPLRSSDMGQYLKLMEVLMDKGVRISCGLRDGSTLQDSNIMGLLIRSDWRLIWTDGEDILRGDYEEHINSYSKYCTEWPSPPSVNVYNGRNYLKYL